MLTTQQATKINYIVLKLKKVISQIDIINWLNNFEKEEWDIALEVLTHLDFFDGNDIISHYEEKIVDIYGEIKNHHTSIERWVKTPSKSIKEKSKKKFLRRRIKIGFNKPIFHAVGKYGKSGTAMMYYATHIPSFKKLKIEPHKSINDFNIKNYYLPTHIILLDDFIGTGRTIVRYINEEIFPFCKKSSISKVKIYILSVVIHEEAKDYINENSLLKEVKFYGQSRRKAFSQKGSVFGYRPRMVVIREFCYKYGINLYKHFNHKEKLETDFPLGYMNSQSLSIFSHTTPNNTLPIIWSTQNGWHPLFPRSTVERISQNKELKKRALMWISIAEKLELSHLINRNSNIYSTENIKLICYIKLLKTGLNRLSIGIKLNLSQSEMNELINIGYQRKILTKRGELAGYGAQLYNEITKETKRKTNRTFSPNEVIYLPKRFRGKV